jgi:hypothetical protein
LETNKNGTGVEADHSVDIISWGILLAVRLLSFV